MDPGRSQHVAATFMPSSSRETPGWQGKPRERGRETNRKTGRRAARDCCRVGGGGVLRAEAGGVTEFFDSKSDFVISLDKVDEHAATAAGEPAVMYVEGEPASRQSLRALRVLHERRPYSVDAAHSPVPRS